MKTLTIVLSALLVNSAAAADPASRSTLSLLAHGSAVDTPTARERPLNPESSEVRVGTRLLETADVAARVEPAGAAVRVGLVLHHGAAIDPSGDHENSYLEGGLAVVATPATLEPQAHIEHLPVPFLVWRAELSAVRYLGVNSGLLNFASRDADFGQRTLAARKGDEQQAWGLRGGLSITPRVKLGRVLLRSKLSLTAYHFDQPGPYVYDADLDALLGVTDLVVSSRSDVLFELHDGPGAETVLLGPTVETRRTIASALSRTRAGLALWYVPTERWANLHQPRLYAQAGINLVDPNRRGEPFGAVGFGADFY